MLPTVCRLQERTIPLQGAVAPRRLPNNRKPLGSLTDRRNTPRAGRERRRVFRNLNASGPSPESQISRRTSNRNKTAIFWRLRIRMFFVFRSLHTFISCLRLLGLGVQRPLKESTPSTGDDKVVGTRIQKRNRQKPRGTVMRGQEVSVPDILLIFHSRFLSISRHAPYVTGADSWRGIAGRCGLLIFSSGAGSSTSSALSTRGELELMDVREK